LIEINWSLSINPFGEIRCLLFIITFFLCGGFLVRAALRFDPKTGVGLDPALHQLATKPHGPLLLVAVALGLAAFGVYQAVLARYRRVLSS